MSLVDLADYDGSAGYLVDSNVWIDCIDIRSGSHDWAIEQLQACSEHAPLHINLIIYTELLVPGPDITFLDKMLAVYDTQRSALPWACAALTAQAFADYRRRGGVRRTPLPDFFIGAHAAIANFAILTRDEAPYRTYYPRLKRVSPISTT